MVKFLTALTGILLGGLLGIAAAVLLATMLSPGGGFDIVFWLVLTVPLLGLIGAVLGTVRALHLLRRVYREAASRGRRVALVPVAGHLLGAPLLTAALFYGAWLCSLPPSDARMLAHFQRHRAEFEQIVHMAQEDRGLIRVDNTWTEPDIPSRIGVPPDRIAAYRQCLQQADAPRGFHATKTGDEVNIYYFTSGSAVSSTTLKGFAYRRTPPTSLRESLDSCFTECRSRSLTYRPIGGGWYLFYQYVAEW